MLCMLKYTRFWIDRSINQLILLICSAQWHYINNYETVIVEGKGTESEEGQVMKVEGKGRARRRSTV